MDILCGEVTSPQFVLIDVDHDLHVLTAIGMWQDRTGDRDKHGANAHDAEVVELRRRLLFGFDLQDSDGHLRGEQPHHHGRGDIRGERFDGSLRYTDDVSLAPCQVNSILEKDINNGVAEVRGTHDSFDAFDRLGQHLFKDSGDPSLRFLWHQAIVEPDDRADGHLDIGEDVGRCLFYRHHSKHYDENGKHHEGIGFF